MFDPINEYIKELAIGFIRWLLEGFTSTFNSSLTILSVEVGKTPMDFSPTVVNTLKGISSNVIVPVAGLILTYIFCYELINLLLEKNNMAEFDVFNLFKAIMKTFIGILLITNCFNITLAFFDVGKTLVQGVQANPTSLTGDFIETMIDSLSQEETATVMGTAAFAFIAWLGTWIGTALIYLIVWSRIVTILIYISVAPIPFATLMNKDWIGHIGQNYIKNLAAYSLQGFLMMITLVVYGALINNVSSSLDNYGMFFGMMMLLVCMFVCVKALMSSLNLAKSIFGAS